MSAVWVHSRVRISRRAKREFRWRNFIGHCSPLSCVSLANFSLGIVAGCPCRSCELPLLPPRCCCLLVSPAHKLHRNRQNALTRKVISRSRSKTTPQSLQRNLRKQNSNSIPAPLLTKPVTTRKRRLVLRRV